MSPSVLLKNIKLLEWPVTEVAGQRLIDGMIELFVKSQLIGNLETFRAQVTDEWLDFHNLLVDRHVKLQFF